MLPFALLVVEGEGVKAQLIDAGEMVTPEAVIIMVPEVV